MEFTEIGPIIVFSLVGLGLIFTILRLILGRTFADRIVALDTLNVIIIGVIAFMSFLLDNSLYLDIALVYAILSFLETIVFARFVEVNNK